MFRFPERMFALPHQGIMGGVHTDSTDKGKEVLSTIPTAMAAPWQRSLCKSPPGWA
jgi:hypothetical protein